MRRGLPLLAEGTARPRRAEAEKNPAKPAPSPYPMLHALPERRHLADRASIGIQNGMVHAQIVEQLFDRGNFRY